MPTTATGAIATRELGAPWQQARFVRHLGCSTSSLTSQSAPGLTRMFLISSCHLQLPWWLATPLRLVFRLRAFFDVLHEWLDLDDVTPEGSDDARTHPEFGWRLTTMRIELVVPPLLWTNQLD